MILNNRHPRPASFLCFLLFACFLPNNYCLALVAPVYMLRNFMDFMSGKSEFRPLLETQFIAALGDPNASSGKDAQEWGIWKVDPGPRGVYLPNYKESIEANNGVAPRGWKFDSNNWWIEEYGRIMEAPQFPIEPGRYLVTGAREVTTGLTIDKDGNWKLDEGTLYDVTHLPCRSAKYCGSSPLEANWSDFPVKPGAEMPNVKGATKQDYAVLFVVGLGKNN